VVGVAIVAAVVMERAGSRLQLGVARALAVGLTSWLHLF